MLTFHNYANVDAAVIKTLKLLGVNVNPQEVIEELEKHPNKSSVLAISDVLHWFKVPNDAYRINADELRDVPAPFIAHTNRNNDFVVVINITGEQVILSDHKNNNYHQSLNEFKKIYNGVVLTFEAPEPTRAFKQGLLDVAAIYKAPAALLGLGLAFILILLSSTNYATNLTWQTSLITLLKQQD